MTKFRQKIPQIKSNYQQILKAMQKSKSYKLDEHLKKSNKNLSSMAKSGASIIKQNDKKSAEMSNRLTRNHPQNDSNLRIGGTKNIIAKQRMLSPVQA